MPKEPLSDSEIAKAYAKMGVVQTNVDEGGVPGMTEIEIGPQTRKALADSIAAGNRFSTLDCD